MLKERVIEWTVEWERQGMEKGLKQGIQQGRQEGILQSLRDGILDVLDSRFGMVTPEITEKVRLINDPIWLKSLLRQAAKMPSLEEFGKLLVRH